MLIVIWMDPIYLAASPGENTAAVALNQTHSLQPALFALVLNKTLFCYGVIQYQIKQTVIFK